MEYKCKALIILTLTIFLTSTVNVYLARATISTYYSPEVAVSNVSISTNLGLGEVPQGLKMKPVYQCIDSWFYTNKQQSITFEVGLVNVKTHQIIVSRKFTVKLHKGLQRIREFVPIKVNSFTKCYVFCKIIKYEYDTNLNNNYAIGDTVTFRPWIDIYPTVTWYPIKQKDPYGLLPGDTVKVCIGIHVPKNVRIPNIHVNYKISVDVIGTYRTKTYLSRNLVINSSGQVSTIWFNHSVTLPWTDKLFVKVSVNNKYDLNPGNNNFSVVIPLSPDAQCTGVYLKNTTLLSGSNIPLKVSIRSNHVNTCGTIEVIDLTAGNKIISLSSMNITKPEQSFTISVKVPNTAGKTEHTWLIYVYEMNDVYRKDNIGMIKVKILKRLDHHLIPHPVPGFKIIDVSLILLLLLRNQKKNKK